MNLPTAKEAGPYHFVPEMLGKILGAKTVLVVIQDDDGIWVVGAAQATAPPALSNVLRIVASQMEAEAEKCPCSECVARRAAQSASRPTLDPPASP